MTDPLPLADASITYGPTGVRCGCGRDAHSNLSPCRPPTRQCPAGDCPGHRLCQTCQSDVCTEASCGGCRCPENVCAWASYRADCPEVYEAAKAAGLPACGGCGGTAERCVCVGGFMAAIES